MLTKQAEYAIYSFYYNQGVQAAAKQAGLSKLAEPNRQESKKKQDTLDTTLRDTLDTTLRDTKDIGSKAKELELTGKALGSKANTYIDTVINKGIRKLPREHQDLAIKAVGAGTGYLKNKATSKAIGAIEPLYVGYKALTPEGREDLLKEYPLQAPRPKSIADAVVDPISDIVSFGTSPLTISGLAAGARTIDRAHKGSKLHYKSIHDAANKGNREEVRRLVESDPRFSTFL